jgi:alkyl hydroperoxide reductase subunit AhpC
MFIIDNKGILRQITINDCHVSRSALEARRLIEAIQHSEKSQPNTSKAGFIKGEKKQNYIYIYEYLCIYFFDRFVIKY